MVKKDEFFKKKEFIHKINYLFLLQLHSFFLYIAFAAKSLCDWELEDLRYWKDWEDAEELSIFYYKSSFFE